VSACFSCGLELGGLELCPGCGTSQAPSAVAKAHDAQCAEHRGAVANFNCSRCGRFGCARCEVEDSGACWSCFDQRVAANGTALTQARKVIVVCSAVYCVLATALTFWLREPTLGALLVLLLSPALILSLVAYVRRRDSTFAWSLMAVSAFVVMPLTLRSALLGVPLAAFTIGGWQVFGRIGTLEREHFNNIRLAAQRNATA
jgi:hypothetical protein